jgi:hypothetical protein
VDAEDAFLKREKRVRVGSQPLMDARDGTRWSENVQRLVHVEIGPHHPVEPDKMVDVVVRDEDRLEVG